MWHNTCLSQKRPSPHIGASEGVVCCGKYIHHRATVLGIKLVDHKGWCISFLWRQNTSFFFFSCNNTCWNELDMVVMHLPNNLGTRFMSVSRSSNTMTTSFHCKDPLVQAYNTQYKVLWPAIILSSRRFPMTTDPEQVTPLVAHRLHFGKCWSQQHFCFTHAWHDPQRLILILCVCLAGIAEQYSGGFGWFDMSKGESSKEESNYAQLGSKKGKRPAW